ncbi:MAG: septum formation initiator family protein [Bryobacteraceae bacterium]
MYDLVGWLTMNFLNYKPKFLTALMIVALFVVIALRGPNSMAALTEKRKEISELQEINATLKAEIERKRVRVEKLTSDPEVQGLEIRDKLKLLRRGEKQIILPQSGPQTK